MCSCFCVCGRACACMRVCVCTHAYAYVCALCMWASRWVMRSCVFVCVHVHLCLLTCVSACSRVLPGPQNHVRPLSWPSGLSFCLLVTLDLTGTASTLQVTVSGKRVGVHCTEVAVGCVQQDPTTTPQHFGPTSKSETLLLPCADGVTHSQRS